MLFIFFLLLADSSSKIINMLVPAYRTSNTSINPIYSFPFLVDHIER